MFFESAPAHDTGNSAFLKRRRDEPGRVIEIAVESVVAIIGLALQRKQTSPAANVP